MMKTDKEIQNDVEDELTWEPRLRSKEINVTVKNGSVTLTGKVDSYSKKIAAQKAAERITGVKEVVNSIEVNPPSTHQKTDSEIKAAVISALAWSTSIPQEKIRVHVKNGWVTL